MIVTKKDGSKIIKVYFVQFGKGNKIEVYISDVDMPEEIDMKDIASIC